MKTITLQISVILIITLFGCSKNDEPGSNQVYMKNLSFTPSSLTISPGTTVTWINKESVTHTVTSNTGAFNSGNLSNGASFTHQFNSTGTYMYHCSIHSGMTGTIIVQ